LAVYSAPVRGSSEGKQPSRGCEFSMPVEPSEETLLHHQPLDSRPTVVRPRLSRGWDDDFYPDRIAKESEPATVVLCDGFGIRCISGSQAGRTWKSATISTCLLPPPAEGCVGEGSCVKNLLAARLYGLLILTWRSRAPWTGLTCWTRDCGVCVGKGTFSDLTRQRRFVCQVQAIRAGGRHQGLQRETPRKQVARCRTAWGCRT
jgi:hypothetical protein